MADTGWLYPGSVVSDGDNGVHWTNPGNATSSNNLYAWVSPLSSGVNTRRLRGYNFGFSLPSGAIVDGIEVGVERKASDTDRAKDYAIRLMDDVTEKGDDKADLVTCWPLSDTNAFYGGAADLWGASWTAAQINASTFGIAVRAKNYSASTVTVYVDTMAIKVTYTIGGYDHLMIMGM